MTGLLEVAVRRHVVDAELEVPLSGPPVTALFGPSGAGKTTLLRCVAGLDRPDAGRVVVDGEVWDGEGRHLPARRRRVGLLFQDHALFPHLDVDGNVAYGLGRLPRRERAARVAEALASAGAAKLAGRRVRELSGGEAQRVALARALAPRPRLLLLDEPLSALDAPTRSRLRTELREVLVREATPTLLVSHDRTEVLALADRVAVLVDGRVLQVGSPAEVFDRPADASVARVVGVETAAAGMVRERSDGLVSVEVRSRLLTAVDLAAPGAGAVADVRPGDAVLVCIRAEDVALELPGRAVGSSPRNHLPGVVTAVTGEGPLVRVDLDCGFHLAAYVTRPAREELGLTPGLAVVATVKSQAVHLVPRLVPTPDDHVQRRVTAERAARPLPRSGEGRDLHGDRGR
ncbi:MAG TPA: ABC transporter ATP-binding protein [Jiangellales bacterium]|nr:ABC transporter ATP-binding protein [Jiangellales bacterium]